MLQRAALAVVAVLALGWLAIESRSRELQYEAGALAFKITGEVRAADLRRADDLLRSAESLSIETEALYRRALYQSSQGDPRQARRLIEKLLEAEPDNAAGWRVLHSLTRGSDPGRARVARAQLERLNPLGLRGGQ